MTNHTLPPLTAPAPPPPATTPVAAPVRPTTSRLRPLGLDEVAITGGLWARMQELNSAVILEHCQIWMERIGWLRNFDRLARSSREPHTGIEFVDSEVYKLLEAMAWELGRLPDDGLENRYRQLVARVAAAQDDDGYLHTAFGHEGQPPRYSNLEWGHELYCHGHLLQAAVARLRTGHDDELPAVARRLVEHLWSAFGPDGRPAICGHPEIEVALAEYSRATGDRRALELARLFVERRGRRTLRTTLYQGSEYFQDDVPVREATVLRGHAVRALYLAAGAYDVAVETGDGSLADAVERQYRATLSCRAYLTGGMGAHHQNEEFGEDFELPSDRAYAETCAAIASVMTSWRLLLATGDPAFGDQIERTLLNAVLVAPRADGRAFYYANTLHQRSRGAVEQDGQLSERAEAVSRAPWFEVSCCPTNLARTLASLAAYIATADDDGVQLQQYASCEIDAVLPGDRRLALRVDTAYPDDGRIRVTILAAPAGPVTLGFRIPSWARGEATLAGAPVAAAARTAAVTESFTPGEVIELVLPMRPRFTYAHRRVDALRGQVAVEAGPLVMALEDVDLPADLDVEHVAVDDSVPPVPGPDGISIQLIAHDDPAQPTPYGRPRTIDGPRLQARLIPYKDWANRGPSTMRVWMPRHTAPLPGHDVAAAEQSYPDRRDTTLHRCD